MNTTNYNVERLPVLNINRQFLSNSKLSHILTTQNLDISGDEFDIKISAKVVNTVKISYTSPIASLSARITPYDMAVMDAAYTIILHGIMLITPEWIINVMAGNERVQMTPKRITAVIDSIQKLQTVRIKIDCTSEYNVYHLQKGEKPLECLTYESFLLPVEKVKARYDSNGNQVAAYRITEKPALYQYAEMNNQIISVPSYLFKTRAHFNDTDEAVLIKRYVIKRVAQIISKNRLHTNKVSLLWHDRTKGEEKGLLPELGYVCSKTPAWRKQKAHIIKIIQGTLSTLVEGNAITGYKEYRADGTNNPASPLVGFEIYYNIRDSSLTPKQNQTKT